MFFHTFDIGGLEHYWICSIQKILLGYNLYENPQVPPFDIIQYAPLHFYLVAFIEKITGINGYNPYDVYLTSRIVALSLNIIMLFIIAAILHKVFRVKVGLNILACVLSFVTLTPHFYSRGDCLYIVLSLGSFAFFLLFIKSVFFKNKVIFLIISCLLAVLTLFTKQSGLMIMGIYVFFLLFINKDYKFLGITIISFIVFGAIIFFSIVPNDQYYTIYQNTILGLNHGYSLFFFISIFTNRYYLDMLCFLIIGIVFSIYFLKQTTIEYKFLGVSIALSLAFGIATGFKIGASLNYLIDFYIFTFIGLAIYLSSIQSEKKIIFKIFIYLAIVIVLFFKSAELFSAVYISHYRSDEKELYDNEKQVTDYFIKDLKVDTSAHIYLADRGSLENFLIRYTVMNHKEVVELTNVRHVFDYSYFKSNANDGYVKYLIVDRKNHPDSFDIKDGSIELFGIKFTNFNMIKKIGEFSIYQYSKI